MDNCSFLEYFKAFTPFIIAFIVYIVWHFQKSNEVLANESKNLIVQINETMLLASEAMDLLRNAYINYEKIPDGLSSLNSKLSDFKIKIHTTTGTLSFLSEAIGDKELEDLSYEYWNKMNTIYNGFDLEMNKVENRVRFQEKDDEYIIMQYNNVADISNKIKRSYMGYAMYRNSWLLKQTGRVNVKIIKRKEK
ncbi:hypothetical protein KTI78_02775 [Acinetobacter sp. WU_MDCI_Abxe161]|uniref:hypothetical protein n=1 Tax=Acinetobacter sp. WU_MDCI_Abxe161 TaxID=2850074 RepID=UPI0021CDAEE7|nr:hypothetical protein [Acinetobacter sp. WU_MDCI_Abxe161]MCU4502084.1 hypothetical protein [Acinetobacter sp. WU_MDCI_Abxe161]